MLLSKLEELFETVEPTQTNLSVYGHKIREIILLACMEMESSWAAVLNENQYQCPASGRLTTNQYVKLSAPMLLDSYTLSLQSYPGFPQFSPFKDWDPGNPTASLDWYHAYNRTKHDREDNLNLATLDIAVKSVGEAVVMFYAQFGFTLGPTGGDLKSPIIRNIFRSQVDFEKHWQECYVPRFTLVDNDPRPVSSDWTPTNYPF